MNFTKDSTHYTHVIFTHQKLILLINRLKRCIFCHFNLGVKSKQVLDPWRWYSSMDACCWPVERDVLNILGKSRQWEVSNNLSKAVVAKGFSSRPIGEMRCLHLVCSLDSKEQRDALMTIKDDLKHWKHRVPKWWRYNVLDCEIYDREIHVPLSNSNSFPKTNQNVWSTPSK